MSALHSAIVAIASSLSLLSLILIYGLLRRLRALEAQLGDSVPSTPRPGHRIKDFSVVTVDGATLGRDDLNGPDTIVALLSVGCEACEKIVTELTARPLGVPVVALIYAGDREAASRLTDTLRRELGDRCRVAVVSHGEVAMAFQVGSFPTLVRVREGVVRAAGSSLSELETADAAHVA